MGEKSAVEEFVWSFFGGGGRVVFFVCDDLGFLFGIEVVRVGFCCCFASRVGIVVVERRFWYGVVGPGGENFTVSFLLPLDYER